MTLFELLIFQWGTKTNTQTDLFTVPALHMGVWVAAATLHCSLATSPPPPPPPYTPPPPPLLLPVVASCASPAVLNSLRSS